MMIAAADVMSRLLFVACKNTPKAAEEAAPKEPDLTALNAGDDLDWEDDCDEEPLWDECGFNPYMGCYDFDC